MKHLKFLFVVKQQQSMTGSGRSWGLLNSAKLAATALAGAGIPAEVAEVVDNNCIDQEVARSRPTHVVIEALWVVPEKMPELLRLHPRVNWIVRVHSKVPFLAEEGIAADWLRRYDPRVTVAANSRDTAEDLTGALARPVAYLPNVYGLPGDLPLPRQRSARDTIEVGCFGAVRPLKNQMQQAVAALRYAAETNRALNFHVNSARLEQRGGEVLKNLRALFAGAGRARLVEHRWHSHAGFLIALERVDISMQVSFTETFNIVTADAVRAGTPVVVSPAISWVPRIFRAEPGSVDSIVRVMRRAEYMGRVGTLINRTALRIYDIRALDAWLSFAES